jgi:hypothetical protein
MQNRAKCPNGTRKNQKSGKCEPHSAKERKNCPKGSRRNKKTQNCDKTITKVAKHAKLAKTVDEICSICLGVIEDDKYKTECNHTFHSKCLGVWCSRLTIDKKTCPFCRENIAADCKKIEPIVSANIFPYVSRMFFGSHDYSDTKKAEADNNRVIQHFLDDHTFDPNVQQRDDGQTPLMIALYYRKCEIAEKLLKLPGIDVNIVDKDNKSALHYAVDNNGQCKAAIELLLKHPDINTDIKAFNRPTNTATALHIALEKNNTTAIALFKKYKKIPKTLKGLV